MSCTARRQLPARHCSPPAKCFVLILIEHMFVRMTYCVPSDDLTRQRDVAAHEQRQQARYERSFVAARELPQGAECHGSVDQCSAVRAVGQLLQRRCETLFKRDGRSVAEAVRKRVIGASFFKRLRDC